MNEETHNRVARSIVREMVTEQVAAGATLPELMTLCESVLVGVMLGCFELGSDVKALDLIVGRVKERLAKVRLEDFEAEG